MSITTKKPEPKITERILPPKFKHLIQNEFIAHLTFIERAKILIGYSLEIKYECLIEQLPGKTEPKMSVRVVNKL